MNIVIIDCQLGNINSIVNMFRKIGFSAKLSSDKAVIKKADKIILPGVGAFDRGMKGLTELGVIETLEELVLQKKIPFLGICLGMQLLFKRSEEGKTSGLGWIDGECVRFKCAGNGLKVPHMGWNEVVMTANNPLLFNVTESRFYFVHSYHAVCDESFVIGKTEYGYPFAAMIRMQNIFGVQFHPEKSHKFGMQLLKNFIEFGTPCCK